MSGNESATCACSDFSASRRSFLRGLGFAAGVATIDIVTNGVFRQVAFGADGTDNVLVVLSLRGGADGLSLVVPHGDPAYALARPRIGVPADTLLARDDMFGLHPSLAPLMPLWNSGKMTAVQAVGLPQPDRSHFTAMEAVEDADPGSSARIGWLNRLIDLEGLTAPQSAVSVGSAMLPTSLYGEAPVLGFRTVGDIRLPGAPEGTQQAVWKRRSLSTLYGGGRSLDQAGRTALSVTQTMRGLGEVRSQASYPAGPLGDALADSVRLIRTQPVRVLTVDYGNWDMHIDVGTLTAGAMKNMAAELAGGVAAFFDDLGDLASRVTLVTLSEFGRRVAENGAGGLDHGYGNAMLVAGAGVRGGSYFAKWPGLSQGRLIDGDLAVTRDYRSVLAEIVSSRFDVSIPSLFPDFTPQTPFGFMA